MPTAAPKPCSVCGVLVSDGTSRCPAHKRPQFIRAKTFADRGRGTRQQRGYGAAWDRLRQYVMTRDAGLCQPCLKAGKVALAREVDHIRPRAWGGTDHEENLQAICKPCHRSKTQREAASGGEGGPTNSGEVP